VKLGTFAHLYLYQTTKILVVDLGIAQSVVGFFFYILSQHLDYLQQLDNLEHSAHLYGQLTTLGCFTTFGQFTTFELLTIFGPFTTVGLLTIL
jgi:hypothetical protein